MRVTIPDYGQIELPNVGVEEARRACVALGFTQVQNATGTKDATTGDVVFARAAGGTKGL